MTTFDLNLLPIHRLNGQDYPDLPGLLALTPPRKTARGREKDNLILYLLVTGNAAFSSSEINELKENAAQAFYQSAGTLTSAMRKAAENINTALLQRNLSATGRGQYALGVLALVVVRDGIEDQGAQCTALLSGPSHAVWVGNGQARHVHDPALSGKGLGSSQNAQTYLAQVELRPDDLLILCGKFPRDWEADLLGERPQTSLEASYRKLTFTKGDLNAVIIQAQIGRGIITTLRAEAAPDTTTTAPTTAVAPPAIVEPQEDIAPPIASQSTTETPAPAESSNGSDKTPEPPSITEEELDELAEFAVQMLQQPSAYALPPQPDVILSALMNKPAAPPQEDSTTTPPPNPATSATPSTPRNFPPSIPRITPVEKNIEQPVADAKLETAKKLAAGTIATAAPAPAETGEKSKPDAHVIATRQMAKGMINAIQVGRHAGENIRSLIQRFIPRLLPGSEMIEVETQKQPIFIMPTYAMVSIALIIPLLIGTMAVVVYLKLGQSVQYDEAYSQALNSRAQASAETEPVRQRDAWQRVLNFVETAESYRETNEADALHSEAQANLDALMGVARLEFFQAFTSGLSNTTQISRMAASESDLYLLDAEHGNILHAAFTGRSLSLDNAFDCQPGTYAGYQVGTLVDLAALPKVNAVGATVMGIDATGTLLYCAPGQVPQALPLPALPNTNWGRITSIAMDSGNLYVLDATARAVWVFVGKDSTFVDTPYFYFSNQIPDTIDTAIDLAVSGDDIYMLHADGHVSTCTFGRIAAIPTRCVDPINFQDPFPAHQDSNLFAQAHLTQISMTAPPNSVVLLLDSENQKVFRFTPRVLELQNQVTGHAGKRNPFEAQPVSAMTVSPNYVLYLAIDNQVYFATNLP